MSDKLIQQYEEVKAEHEVVQKSLAELAAKQAELENELVRLNTVIQVRRVFPEHSVGYPLYNR
jgi:hypothetical protein